MDRTKCTAIVVAGGRGIRMGTEVRKQYLTLDGKPVLWYTLNAFQQSSCIDEIILVTEESQVEYCSNVFQRHYCLDKIHAIVPGGAERSDSVYEGLRTCEDAGYVFIHDGVRPFVTEAIIRRGLACAEKYGSGIAGVPVKDTVKIADANGNVIETPLRSRVWSVQTPQVFRYSIVRESYDRLQLFDKDGITDDAMVVEEMSGNPVHLFRGDYRNIKITTPDDLPIAQEYAREINAGTFREEQDAENFSPAEK